MRAHSAKRTNENRKDEHLLIALCVEIGEIAGVTCVVSPSLLRARARKLILHRQASTFAVYPRTMRVKVTAIEKCKGVFRSSRESSHPWLSRGKDQPEWKLANNGFSRSGIMGFRGSIIIPRRRRYRHHYTRITTIWTVSIFTAYRF